MCSIAGLIGKRGEDVIDKLKKMLELMEHWGPDDSGIAIGTSAVKAESVEKLNVENLEGDAGIGHSRLGITGTTGTQPFFSCDKRFFLGFNGEIWNYRKLREELKSLDHKFKTDSDNEVVVHLIEEKYKHTSSFITAVYKAVKEVDGEYAFSVYDTLGGKFALVRDPVGAKQIYYGEDSNFIGFCSEKKPLWNLNLKPKRVSPGEIVEIKSDKFDNSSLEIHVANKLKKNKIKIHNESFAVKEYGKILFEAVKKRVRGQRKMGIIFSGGIDSTLIAQIARKLGVNITCYSAGFSNSPDIVNAKRVAQKLGFKLRVNEITKEKIEQELRNIITAIESANHLQVDAAIPVYFAVKLAKEDGIKVMLNGQGADELFAGYSWYPGILREKGGDYLNKCLWNDLKNAYKETLEREESLAKYNNIEIRVPYVDTEVIKIAMSISEKLKIKGGKVKYLHRKFADSIGIPSFITWRPKEAAQHGSGVHKALRKIIKDKKREISSEKLGKSGKKTSKLKIKEKLGSVYRYDQNIYSNYEDIQKVLDFIGAEIGIY